MHKKLTALLPLLLASMLSAQDASQEVINTGEKVSAELLKQLGTKLKHEIKTNGLVAAANFCNTNAITLTEEVNLHQLAGISVKRTSLKERNPENLPQDDERKVLEQMQNMLKGKKLPAYILKKENKTYKYYKPLVIKNQTCLACHGDISTNPELSAFMKEHYPEDKATGYKMGELRGAIVVEIKE